MQRDKPPVFLSSSLRIPRILRDSTAILIKIEHNHNITMVMSTLQIRMQTDMIKKLDSLVKTGLYSSRADVIRDSVRRLLLDMMTGIAPKNGDTVAQVRKIRSDLSLDQINDILK